MKKLTLGILLLVLVLAVSYYKAVNDRERSEESFDNGRKSGEMEALALAGDVDSLHQYIGKQNVTFAESLTIQQKKYRKELDSISEEVENKDVELYKMGQKLKLDPKSKTAAIGSKPKSIRHLELLAYYKKRYESLPGDLTNYEMKIAITEIRQETAEKYTMSIADLNKIREKNNIDY